MGAIPLGEPIGAWGSEGASLIFTGLRSFLRRPRLLWTNKSTQSDDLTQMLRAGNIAVLKRAEFIIMISCATIPPPIPRTDAPRSRKARFRTAA